MSSSHRNGSSGEVCAWAAGARRASAIRAQISDFMPRLLAFGALFAYMSAAMSRPFLKMNGLGNDFVVVEARSAPFAPSAEEVRAIADRAGGVGCDQLIAIEPADEA